MSNLSLKLEQKAKILQVQRLTIQMLALHGQDLVDFLQEQVTANPLLDICYHDVRSDEEKDRKAIENVHNHGASLEAKLMAQLRVQTLPKPVMLKIIRSPFLCVCVQFPAYVSAFGYTSPCYDTYSIILLFFSEKFKVQDQALSRPEYGIARRCETKAPARS